jgi:hypothetical protein
VAAAGGGEEQEGQRDQEARREEGEDTVFSFSKLPDEKKSSYQFQTPQQQML